MTAVGECLEFWPVAHLHHRSVFFSDQRLWFCGAVALFEFNSLFSIRSLSVEVFRPSYPAPCATDS